MEVGEVGIARYRINRLVADAVASRCRRRAMMVGYLLMRDVDVRTGQSLLDGFGFRDGFHVAEIRRRLGSKLL